MFSFIFSGGVVIYFDRIEVVNQLQAEYGINECLIYFLKNRPIILQICI